MIIGFSKKTYKILPKIFCKKFRHCAVIIEQRINSKEHKYLILNPSFGKVDLFVLKNRDMIILSKYDWVFLNINLKKENNTSALFSIKYSLSCVNFAKRASGIKNPFIFTPDQLYRHLKKLL